MHTSSALEHGREKRPFRASLAGSCISICKAGGEREPPSDHLASSLTGVTRGKRLAVLIGQKEAVAIAVRNEVPLLNKYSAEKGEQD